MMDLKKLYKAAKAAGIAPFEARETVEAKTSIALFNDQLESFTVADNGSVKVRGLVDGKCGTFTSDRVDDEIIDLAVSAVKDAALYGQPVDPEFFIPGDKYKYEKVNTYNDKLAKVPADRLIELAKTIAQKSLAADKRINLIQTQVEYSYGLDRFTNSNGLDLKGESNYIMVFANTKAVEGEKVESGMNYAVLSDLDGFDVDAFVKELVKITVGQLGGEMVKSAKYDVVYSPECVAALLMPLNSGFSAFAVEQHVSLLEGKIGSKVFSELLTLEQTPIGDEVFCSAFDADGVPCRNSLLIDKGVPTGYVYDLDTAKRAGVESTGNGSLQGGNIRPAVHFATVHPGDKTKEGLFETVNNGLYITDISGVGTGLNPQSGDYSLQACGYVIENGKLTKPVSLITVASNIMTDLANIFAVGNDTKLTYYGIKTPSVAIKAVSVSGK